MSATAPALVISRYGSEMLIELPDTDLVKAKSRRKNQDIVCGDQVAWAQTQAHEYVVTHIQPRHNLLKRRYFRGRERNIAANIEQLVIVTASHPDPDWDMVDNLLVVAEIQLNVPAIVLHHKHDLPISATHSTIYAEYQRIGYPVYATSRIDAASLHALLGTLNRQTSVLIGQSGVGKSTLINTLIPHAQALTQSLSDRTGLGQHTTSSAFYYHLPTAGAIIDTPGIRDFTPSQFATSQWQHGFREFAPYLGHCRFHNCLHIKEPDCAVKNAVENGKISQRRYTSYLQLVTQQSTDKTN